MRKTAESVTPMHPDKLCDRISDAILDACLEKDPLSRVAVETMGGHGVIHVCGEVTTSAYVDVNLIVRKIVGDKYGVESNIVHQSPEIANGVNPGGAGDQGIMVGYACNDNEEFIPQELYLARSLCKYIYATFPFDGKTQITIDDTGAIDTIVASFQNVNQLELKQKIMEWVKLWIQKRGEPVFAGKMKIFPNPAGDWNIGGFEADTGLTGRKLMVDNYGPQVPIGGGCFSGKDSTKVDRSAAYMARKIAVDLIRGTNRKEAIVKLAYAIGVAEPVQAVAVVDGKEINILEYGYDLTPQGIIKALDLRKPQFEATAQWGHFGHGFTWDKK